MSGQHRLAGNGVALVRERALAADMQHALERVYRLDRVVDVGDFVRDAEDGRESVLLRESEDGGLEMSVQLPKLADDATLDGVCQIIEGVSHFVYLVERARVERTATQLELEMQAEVDKYVSSYWLMREQFPGRFPAELLNVLFERTRIDSRLARGRESLYREATRYAQKFCRRLERSLRGARGDSGGEILAELRRFYRLTNTRKLAHIERSA